MLCYVYWLPCLCNSISPRRRPQRSAHQSPQPYRTAYPSCTNLRERILKMSMELSKAIPRSVPARLARSAVSHSNGSVPALAYSPMAIWSRRQFTSDSKNQFPGPQGLGLGGGSGGQSNYFQKSQSLPANTIIRFVPQQTAWIVERMGKFNRILSPGLAILIPVIDVRCPLLSAIGN